MKKKTGYPSLDQPQNEGYSFLAKHPIIPNLSIYNALKIINMFYQGKEAVNCLDLEANYKKLFEDSITISRALKELGVRKGEIVSVSMPNYYQAVATFLACNRIGATVTFLNPRASVEETTDYLNLFESPIFINYNKSEEENLKYQENSCLKYIITLEESNKNNLCLNNDYKISKKDSLINFNSLGSISKFQKKGFSQNRGKDNALILFTSGTTGKPKSVVLTNENILAAATYLKNSSHVKKLNGEKTLVCVPFSYPYGFVTSTLMTLMSSKTAILAPDISKDTISYYMKKNPNIIFGSPALLDLMMKNIPNEQDLSSITTFISGGDFLTPKHHQIAKEFFEKHNAYNVEIGNGSGNAETVSCGTNPTGVEIRLETAGKVLTGTSALIVDPQTMKEKKYNEEGVLLVSGKHVFKEYYKDPEETNKVKVKIGDKVYFNTGTLGSIDEDGYFKITGRESRFYINSSLNKIYCDYVQTLITDIPIVKECAVVKVPDEDMLYVNKAYIVLKENKDSDEKEEEELKKAFNRPILTSNNEVKMLKSYEIPTYVEIVNELPRKEGTEKVNYKLLEEKSLISVKEKVKRFKN